MNKIFIVLGIILTANCVFAQMHPEHKRANVWYFGQYPAAGLDFNSGTPVALTDAYTEPSFASSICDTSGNLLFYSNGEMVWNRNHQMMQNGSGLNGNLGSNGGTLIVPVPHRDSLYFIFTGGGYDAGVAKGWYYSIVNMNLAGGLGAVVVKNVEVFPPYDYYESTTGTYHKNGNDFWIVTRNRHNMMYSFLLTSNGLSAVVDSLHATGVQEYFGYMHQTSQVKFSPAGDMLYIQEDGTPTYWGGTISLITFDRGTGLFMDQQVIFKDSTKFFHAPSFSPSGNRLYVVAHDGTSPGIESYIFYYEVSPSLDSMAIVSSLDTIVYSPNIRIWDMQNTPLGEMVISNNNYNDGWNCAKFLSEIHNPDYATALDVTVNSIDLLGRKCTPFMQNTIEDWFYRPLNTSIPNKSESRVLVVYPNPTHGLLVVKGSEVSSFAIYDLTGRKLDEKKDCGYITQTYLSYNPGVYLLEVTDVKQRKSLFKILLTN